MTPDPDVLVERLLRAGRSARTPTDAAEFAFETRLMARIRSERTGEAAQGLLIWRFVSSCAALVLLLGVWHVASPVDELGGMASAIAGEAHHSMVAAYSMGD